MHELANWASEHYGVGLLTNIMPGMVDAMLKQGLLPNIAFDTIIDSSEVHAIKPEAKIYEIATERAAQAPEEILLIDDSRANLMAAERFNWHVLWFDDYRPAESAERIKQVLEPAEAMATVATNQPSLQAA
jgi:FMN phosphatase YigB (HAD superfamily)